MRDIRQPRELYASILVLLGLGCTPKGDAEVAATAAAKVDEVKSDGEKEPIDEDAPSTAIEPEPEPMPEPEPEPPDTGMDDEVAEPPEDEELPEGAQFCFDLEQARSIAEAPDIVDAASTCPKQLDLGKTRALVESWGRRTGGPWDESVPFVASVAPEGEQARCCYRHAFAKIPGSGPSRGRPLLVEDAAGVRVIVPQTSAALDDAGWLADARVEHASVAAFARAVLESMSVGAPPRLLRANLRAAVDELEHARLCAERAGVDVRVLGALEPVAARPSSIVALAERTLLEACIPETLGTLAAARAAARAEAEGARAVARVRAQIAEDEARHAAAAWATLRWARSVDRPGVDARLAEIGDRVRELAREVVRAEPALDEAELPALFAELLQPLISGRC